MHTNLVFNTSDSKETVSTETNFLKGGTLSMFWGATQNLIVIEEVIREILFKVGG